MNNRFFKGANRWLQNENYALQTCPQTGTHVYTVHACVCKVLYKVQACTRRARYNKNCSPSLYS